MAFEEFSGFTRVAKAILYDSDMIRNKPEYKKEEQQMIRETLRGVTYILEKLNRLERRLDELDKKEEWEAK